MTPAAGNGDRGGLQRLRAGSDAVVAAPGSERRRFDKLLHELERLRTELADWSEALPRWQARHHEHIQPLFEARIALDVELVELLDRASFTIKLAKGDRTFLSALLCNLAEGLIAAGRVELAPIQDRHSASAGDGDEAAFEEAAKQAIGMACGLSPEELEAFDSPEALYEQLQARMREQQAHARHRQEQRRKRADAKRQADEPPPLRDLFRKLAAALHPDRARDAADAERRTVLMQRLNAASKANDLVGMIELQAEIGLLDAAGVDAMGEERLKQYNRQLARQVKDVRAELDRVAFGFCEDYGLSLPRRPAPRQLDKLLAGIRRELEQDIQMIRHDLRDLESPQTLKRWLKQQRSLAEHMQPFEDWM